MASQVALRFQIHLHSLVHQGAQQTALPTPRMEDFAPNADWCRGPPPTEPQTAYVIKPTQICCLSFDQLTRSASQEPRPPDVHLHGAAADVLERMAGAVLRERFLRPDRHAYSLCRGACSNEVQCFTWLGRSSSHAKLSYLSLARHWDHFSDAVFLNLLPKSIVFLKRHMQRAS